jgi:hypothetical protein
MTCFILDIPRWRPALQNELMKSVKAIAIFTWM